MESEESFQQVTFSALELLGSPTDKRPGNKKFKEKRKAQSKNIYDSDSDEDTNYGFRQALPVAEGEPDFSIEEPLTAEEYLKRVRYGYKHNIFEFKYKLEQKRT